MGETAQILALWRRAQAHGEKVCLATVVHVEGSSYRKPGARMLVTSGGERAGTISGGCLEAEVSRKAWWLTADGPAVEQYQSSFDEDGGGVPWGLGCGGTVWVLLEQEPTAILCAMEAALESSRAAVIVSRLAAPAQTLAVVSAQAFANLELSQAPPRKRAYVSAEKLPAPLRQAAARAFRDCKTLALNETFSPVGTFSPIEAFSPANALPMYFVEYLAPPPRLTIFGAGDDAQPIARFASALGWRVAVADGRSHLLRRERFAEAAELRLLHYPSDPAPALSPILCGLAEAPSGSTPQSIPNPSLPVDAKAAKAVEVPQRPHFPSIPRVATGIEPGEFAVLLTHSFEQDRALLAALLPTPLPYLGILGPRHRTLRLLEEVAPVIGWTVEQCLTRLHSPIGLDLGGRDPAAIALSIMAEMQAILAGRQVLVSRSEPEAIHV